MNYQIIYEHPRWLKLWLAFATAILIFRIVTGILDFLFIIVLEPALVDAFSLVMAYRYPITIGTAIIAAVLGERGQEQMLSKNSIRASYILLIVVTLLALNPVFISFDLQPVRVSNEPTSEPVQRVEFELRLAENELRSGLTAVTDPRTGLQAYRHTTPVLTNLDVESTRLGTDKFGGP
jgi:hypothetical protein